jgi:transposase
LWEFIEPLIPRVTRRYRYPGRKRLDDRKVLSGILFVLQTGIPWDYLPRKMGCGSGMTCWRRLREWQEAGVWQRLHELLLAKLNEADRIGSSWAAIDSSHVRAFGGREDRPPSPLDRSRSDSKHHVITCGRGTPLACSLTGGNRNDITQLIPLVDAIPTVRGRRGRPRRRPCNLYGDRAYHSRDGRNRLRRRHIQARIAWPKREHGSGLGTRRWVVERTIAWLHQYRRLRIRYERGDDIHEAFLAIGCSLICLKPLRGETSVC